MKGLHREYTPKVSEDSRLAARRFPALFESGHRGTIDQFELCSELPAESLIGNAYLVGVHKGRYLSIEQEDGRLTVPGGKKDPGESFNETLRRELMEEAGATVLKYQVFGAWYLKLRGAAPFLPHLPHPFMYMVVAVGEVVLGDEPTNPDDALRTTRVRLEPLSKCIERFELHGRRDLAELYALAAESRSKL